MRVFILPMILLLFSSVLSAEVFRWTDASGRTVFGDNPPEQIKAQMVELPTLTVADSYDAGAQQDNTSATDKADESDDSETVEYKRFAVTSPQTDEAVRANNGNVMVRLALEPALQEGHGVVIYLDGKQVASGDATAYSLENIDRGRHSLFAVLHNAHDDVLKNTEAVSFNLLRASIRR